MRKIRRKKEPKPFNRWRYHLHRPLTFAEELLIIAVLIIFIMIIAKLS